MGGLPPSIHPRGRRTRRPREPLGTRTRHGGGVGCECIHACQEGAPPHTTTHCPTHNPHWPRTSKKRCSSVAAPLDAHASPLSFPKRPPFLVGSGKGGNRPRRNLFSIEVRICCLFLHACAPGPCPLPFHCLRCLLCHCTGCPCDCPPPHLTRTKHPARNARPLPAAYTDECLPRTPRRQRGMKTRGPTPR